MIPEERGRLRNKSKLSRRHVIILITGTLLFVPSLWVGFQFDDFYYLGAIEGRFPDHDTRRGLFTFFINDEAATAAIAREGGYPWWIDERVKGETFRPLSDLLIRFDHRLHGKSAVGYHVHSLAWWFATLLACGLLFRRVLPGAIGTLAFLLFAVDDVHVMPVAWIANRNALVALAPIVFALWAWIRWKQDGWGPGRLLAPLGIVVGMAGSELWLAAIAYLVSYALLGTDAVGIRARLRDLAPIVVLGGAYALTYKLLGYSSSGSGVYHDPIEDPAAFLAFVATGVPALLASAIVGFSADFWFSIPSLHAAQVIVGLLAILCLVVLLRACWYEFNDPTRTALRWLLAGSALSLLPIAAVFPSDRMLLVPGIGLSAAIATILVHAFRSWRPRRRWLLVGVGGYLAIVHLVLAPLFAVGIQGFLITHGRRSFEIASSPVVAAAGGKEAIVIFAPDHIVGLYLPQMIEHLGNPAPKSWRPLSIAPFDHWLRRPGERTLELEVVEGGVMLRSLFEELYRDPAERLIPGTILDRGLLQVEIVAANNRGPTRVAFHFDRDLSDPTLYFLIWEEGDLRVADLPAVGEERFVRRTLGPAGF